jgi:hypothetical protein
MHSRCKSICRRILWLLPLALLLSFSQAVPGAWAQYDTYAGPVKFTVTNKDLNDKGKFVTKTSKVIGTFYLYVGPEGPVANERGNFAEFIDALGIRVAVKQLLLPKTSVASSKTDSLRGMGVGLFFDNDDNGVLLPDPGPMYVDISAGTVVKDAPGPTGAVKKINLTMKMAGGTNNNGVWSGSPHVTLTLATITVGE